MQRFHNGTHLYPLRAFPKAVLLMDSTPVSGPNGLVYVQFFNDDLHAFPEYRPAADPNQNLALSESGNLLTG